MKKFIIKISAFISAIIILYIAFIAFLFLTPPTPRISKTEIFGIIQKDSLLLNESSPRIIFVGGSNLFLGLNSQIIKDSLAFNPINTAINASFGIKYMLENTLQYVKKGDIIVLVPEYQHFYRGWDWGSEYLLRTVIDINHSNIKLLSLRQIINCIPYVGKPVLSKFRVSEYTNNNIDEIYNIYSSNQYGDAYLHWNMPGKTVIPYSALASKDYCPQVMTGIKKYSQKVQEKGASLFISYPGLQDDSFLNFKEAIQKIEQDYIASGLTLLGTPERYKMPDSLLFDYPYHLTKVGTDYRTRLLIEDIQKQIAHEKEFSKITGIKP
jgi:hypothetical protein